LKLISWAVSLGSGTSGGTLAPLFTIGSGLGLLLGAMFAHFSPHAHVDVRIAALVGMAAIFAGASRALLTSAVFAFETTLQPLGLLPLIGGCTAAFLVSCILMRNTIMTEKIARRGIRVPAEYEADYLDQIVVASVALKTVVTLKAEDTVETVRAWIVSGAAGTRHQGFPVLEENGVLVGVLTRRDFLAPEIGGQIIVRELIKRPPKFVYSDSTLRDAADHMVNHDIGRLPVVNRATRKVVGMITRSDVLSAHRRRLRESDHAQPTLRLRDVRAGFAPRTEVRTANPTAQ
jgi:CBS domain-containing protein